GAGTSLAQWRLLKRTADTQMRLLADQPPVQRDVAYFRARIGTVEGAEDLVADDRLLRFAATAFGMEDQAYAKALLRKVLDSDLNDPRSFANRLSDGRYKEMASAFNFRRFGGAKPDIPAFVQQVVDRYMTQRFEEQAGRSNEALRLGLYFERKAAGVQNWYQVLADPALARVARTALNLPEATARTDIDRQVAALRDRFDIAKLQDRGEVGKLVERFMVLTDVQGGGRTDRAAGPLATLFNPGGGRMVLDPGTILAASRLRR
ncbi:MAG: hypothetical protein RLY86_4183, partial [Pseudomonadota bacterium]